MSDDDFSAPWYFDPRRPELAAYPSRLDSSLGEAELADRLVQIGEYQRRLWANRQRALLLVVHGPDASGKDSLIRTLATHVDPAGFHAWSFGRPTALEARHDFLWRTVSLLPALGEMVAFNRSYHEAVMAERLWPVRAPAHYDWPARHASIRHFERHLVQEGTTILKVWLHLSEDEQRRRLLKRLDQPRKRWKFDPSDVEAWRRRAEYRAVVAEAMAATHTEEAPWLIIPGDRKADARALVAGIVAQRLQALAPEYPPRDEAVLARYRGLLEGRD
ncbi:MAG: polyphosphate kinase [Marinobacter sp.]|uniref:polyphosphate kinase 2 family protein n=1 Tax=Marinobacter sp. TaxID=50741 RepID=UPI00299F24B1|nr:polyphosphate kinase [Marinobacter sp.]MDX1757773.1 polyphosphate kinase [Marinobacter sp.]